MEQISGAIKKFVLGKQNSLFENICICVAVNLASAFIWFDNHYFYSDFLSWVASVLLVLMWLWCGFLSGKSKDWGFLVFSGIYWIVPYVYIQLYFSFDSINGPFAIMMYKYADMIFNMPLNTIAEFTNCGVHIWALSLVILTGTAYFVGINVADIYKDKEKPGYAEDTEDDET